MRKYGKPFSLLYLKPCLYLQAIFDSVFCYFPITFRPPPDDPYGISAQDLKNRLRDCIAASEYFAPFAFPQLLDKLDSTSPNVKVRLLALTHPRALTLSRKMYCRLLPHVRPLTA